MIGLLAGVVYSRRPKDFDGSKAAWEKRQQAAAVHIHIRIQVRIRMKADSMLDDSVRITASFGNAAGGAER